MNDLRDPKLIQRAERLLRELALISDAPGTSVAKTRSGTRKMTAKEPPGTRLDKYSGPPSKDTSLLAFYMWHFAHAANDVHLLHICFWAELDLLQHKNRRDFEQKRLSAALPQDDKKAQQYVVDHYAGSSPQQVSSLLGSDDTLVPWVEKARRVHRRDIATGYPRRGWDGWDEARRVEEIRKLRDRHMGQRKVAARLEVGVTTIQRYWGHAEPRRAA